MSQCDTNLVRRLEEDFKITLQQQNSLEEWANWLKSVVDEVLKPYVGKKSYIKAAREFLLKWSFYRYIFVTVSRCPSDCLEQLPEMGYRQNYLAVCFAKGLRY